MVKKSKLVLVWDKPGYASLQQAYDYIRKDSVSNADKVRKQILAMADNLPDHPQKHPPDKFKRNNKGNYRAFEKHAYRIAYRITEKEIIILRVRHVKLEPKKY